jgi:hypothetical protein
MVGRQAGIPQSRHQFRLQRSADSVTMVRGLRDVFRRRPIGAQTGGRKPVPIQEGPLADLLLSSW